MPDAELREPRGRGQAPRAGGAGGPGPAHARRARRCAALATEFACQWLEIRGFDQHDEKSEQVFPEFAALRGRDVRGGRPVLHRPLPARTAPCSRCSTPTIRSSTSRWRRHYGIPGVSGPRVAAGRRGQGSGARRRAGDGGPARQAVRRLADQPHPAGQLAARSRSWARSCPSRPRTCRCCPRASSTPAA